MMGYNSLERRTKLSLQKPLPQRCEELTQIFEEFSSKDLHTFFPQLLSSIFGFGGGSDWGLKYSLHGRETEALKAFLVPGGGIFTLIKKLQADPQLRYEFFTSCLPYPTRRTLAEGVIPSLYVNKVQVSNGAKTTVGSSISLNAFEYFMFHFAYYIVYPHTYKENNWSGVSDVVYVAIFEEYLKKYFPADGSGIKVSSQLQSSSSSKLPSRPSLQRTTLPWQPSMLPGHSSLPGLIRSNSCGPGITKSLPHRDLTSQETWQSETFFQILVEFWLNQNTLDSMNNSYLQPDQEYFMPTLDHVRFVRILIKHIHNFVSSGGVYSDITSLPSSATDELRRTILSQIFQKKFYVFLRHGFAHWPLDPTFRMMLETWLSYIQPWRYLGLQKADQKETAGEKWKTFIMDNFLFYTKLFHEFLLRAFRLDLHLPKDAQLLHRVTKVFSQPNLIDILEEGEEALITPTSRTPPRRSSTFASHPVNNMRQHFTELEGPSFQYDSFFSQTTLDKIKQVMQKITMTLKDHQVLAANEQSTEQSGAMTDTVWNWFNTVWEPASGNGYLSVQEEKKVAQFLTQTQTFLTTMFKLDTIASTPQSKTVTWGHTTNSSVTPGPSTPPSHMAPSSSTPQKDPSLPDCIETEEGLVLSPLGRYQIANGIRKFEVTYQGDPELQPIRSYENPTIVRKLYLLSKALNERVGPTLQNAYNNQGVVGSVLGYFSPALKAPISPRHGPMHSPSYRQAQNRQCVPYVSLRFLASYKSLGYLGMFFVVSWLFSLSPLLVISVVVLFVVFGILLHVHPQHQVKQD